MEGGENKKFLEGKMVGMRNVVKESNKGNDWLDGVVGRGGWEGWLGGVVGRGGGWEGWLGGVVGRGGWLGGGGGWEGWLGGVVGRGG